MPTNQDDVIKNYLSKVKLLNKYNKSYFNQDKPLVTDHQYDELKKEILKLESDNQFLNKFGSISEKVGYQPSSKFKKIKHAKPMLSLANAFDKTDVEDFIKKINNFLIANCLKFLSQNSQDPPLDH